MEFNKEHLPVIKSGHLRKRDVPGVTMPPWRLTAKAIEELFDLLGFPLIGDFTLFAVVETERVITVVTLRPAVRGRGIELVPVGYER